MLKQKKIIAAVLAASMMSSVFTGGVFAADEPVIQVNAVLTGTASAADEDKSEAIIYGDLNGDEKTDLTDLSRLSLYLLNDMDFSDEQTEAADIDASGFVDIADLAYYKQYVCQDKEVMGLLRIGVKKVWENLDPPAKSEGESTNTSVVPVSDNENGVCTITDEGLVNIRNKTVSFGLADALNKAQSDEVIDITARPYIDYDFEYNGKTINDYFKDRCDEGILPEKYGQILKDGESLKYGTMLYEGGTPDGERWAQSLYEERIGFYGQDFLDKYIVNGEFLADKVYKDMENKQTPMQDAFEEAMNAYYQYLADKLNASSVNCEVLKNQGILLHVTAEEFKSFDAEKIEAWTFSLYRVSKTADDCGFVETEDC